MHNGDDAGHAPLVLDVTWYEVTAAPPEKNGAGHTRVAVVSPATPEGTPGGQGTPALIVVVVGLLVPPSPTDRTLIR